MKSNFEFLDKEFPVLSQFGKKAEAYLYSDSNSCLMKLGMIGETVVNLMFTYDRIMPPSENTAVNRIGVLFREGLLTQDLVDILHALRKVRNKAVHENYSSVEEGKVLLQMAHSLCEWFMQTYGDWNYQTVPFVMPTESQEQDIADTDDAQEESLVKEAEEKAAASSNSVTKEKRRQQAAKAASQRQKTEAETRYIIDQQLRQVGWEADTENLRFSNGTRPAKGRNLAIAEWPTDSTVGNHGRADYALFIGLQFVGIIEAKAEHKDIPSVIDYQGKDYPRNIRVDDAQYQVGSWGSYKVPFTFATNGRPYLEQYRTKSGIWFLDLRKPSNVPKALRGWMSPENLLDLLGKDIDAGNRALEQMPFDLLRDKDGLNLRDYQLRAIQAAEQIIMEGKNTALLAMATGTGKTRTVLGMIYRFLKTGRFKRILFLVDRTALGEQALDVFKEVKLEDLMPLADIYNIKGLEDKEIERETRIQVATVQGMVKRILYNDGETMPAVNDYDLIIIDEAHRGYLLDKEMGDTELLYRDQRDYQSKYRSVIEYFDAVKIALTATPALQTTEIFGQPIFKYTYREAVIEGYLVDHDAPHDLHTKLRDEGIHYQSGDTVTVYDPVTGEITNSELLNDELNFDVEQFNKKVITRPFNEAVLAEIAKDIDPENLEEQGKTLIYAVDDQHADMIVDILKNIYSEYGVDNDAIMKITGSVGGGNPKKVQEAIKRFKNERYPSVAVTVDLLTTGIDVPEITNLVFLRRVKSRILFEQMLGRATRLCPKIHKTHFEIYDPVGVYESLDAVNTMKPVVANPSASFGQLLDGLEVLEDEKQIEYQIDQIIAKLQRKKRKLDGKTMEHFVSMTGGMDPTQFIQQLEQEPPQQARNHILAHRDLFELLGETRANGGRPVVISDAPDELISHTRGYGTGSRPEDYLDAFADYVKTHINEIAALNIVCTRPKELTRASLKDLRLTLDREGFTTQQLNTAISELTNEEMAADIISLIRRYAIGSTLISHEARIRRAVDKLKKAHKFTAIEQKWIGRMEKYLMEESVLNIGAFDEDTRFRSEGGFKKIDRIFQNKLESIVLELNEYLYDDGGRSA
ncbi:type I restriction-modification system endonuclease [Anaeromassilibacillus sp. An200]|uniref:type I restriction-modification system endonuclease n=1 Tax=Anaeromassilibacillus sp. An200 TaxID=1965587 RepID=UPI000B38BD12|nr:type I restriction-modification system endonuclease [Anaeromassilibacillus sp. An200]OUP07006.1 type I restriction-modification system endonuclease [Anaeromassilibacillus sp. An200]